MRRAAALTFAATVLIGLWVGYSYLFAPGTYRLAFCYLAVVFGALCLHVTALRRFHRMTVTIRKAEKAGLAEQGSTLFAANQRFRYAARCVEALWLAGLGALLILEVHHPALAAHKGFGWFVLTYIIGPPLLTGYLTFRDLRVASSVNKADRRHAVELVEFHDAP